MRDLYEADVHQPGIYESGRVWVNAWNVFSRTPSRGGRGRRAAAVDFVVCLGCGEISCFFSLCFLRTHTACCKYEAALPHLHVSLLVLVQQHVVSYTLV